MTTTGSQSAILKNGLSTLAFARRTTDSLLEGIAADKLTHQPVKTGNHALWVMGHLAFADDLFLTKVARLASSFPQEYAGLFGMGSEPTGNAGDYPPADEVRQVYTEQRRRLLDWFQGMSDEQLAQPLPDDLKMFAENNGMLMCTLAAHECMHGGQLTVVRKSLGLPRKMG